MIGAARARRGNALILTAGLLALLVIMATAYISRTQTERSTAAATQAAITRNDGAASLADLIAGEISDALFVRLVNDDPAPPAGQGTGDPEVIDPLGQRIADASFPRFALAPDAVRYGVDGAYPYNHAPYHTIAWTNLPDDLTLGNTSLYPPIAAQPVAFPTYIENHPLYAGGVHPAEDKLGNPGFGDNRWLRSFEPFRFIPPSTTATPAEIGPDGIPYSGDELTVFTHWPHLTNLARPENGFRIVFDITDVGDSDGDGYGLLVTDLNFPIEQWRPIAWNPTPGFEHYDNVPALTDITTTASLASGLNPSFLNVDELPAGQNFFLKRWRNWMFYDSTIPLIGWPEAFRLGSDGAGGLGGIPANFLQFNDLNGNGIIHEPGERPQDEFIFGSARHTVGRILTDTDGDGFTDAFWHLVPSPPGSGTRMLVAMSIIDNGAMVNVNTAGRFMFADVQYVPPIALPPSSGFGAFDPLSNPLTASAGHTPSDITLVGDLRPMYPAGTPTGFLASGFPNWNVGLLDNPAHQEFWWSPSLAPGLNPYGNTVAGLYWQSWAGTGTGAAVDDYNFLLELGVKNNALLPDQLQTQTDRLRYWRGMSRPLAPQHDLTPFTLADEIELRMFAGQNYAWIASRLEKAMQVQVGDETLVQALRGNIAREESSEYLDQLNNVELLRDLRHRMTTYNGQRNDLLPPWLWWEPQIDWTVSPPGGALPPPVRVLRLLDRVAAGDPALSGLTIFDIRDNFLAQSRQKLDLRDALDATVDGSLPGAGVGTSLPAYAPYNRGLLPFRERLVSTLQLALVDYFDPTKSYFGTQATTEKAATSLAANIEGYRSPGDAPMYPDPLHPSLDPTSGTFAASPSQMAHAAVLVNQADPTNSARYVGVERQPYIVEAFVAHVYAKAVVNQQAFATWYSSQPGASTVLPGAVDPIHVPGPGHDPDPTDGFTPDFGVPANTPFVDSSSDQTTIVVVQIANPYNDFDETGKPLLEQGIDLRNYAIRVFGRTVNLEDYFTLYTALNPFLRPATEEKPRTAIFYSIINGSPPGQPTLGPDPSLPGGGEATPVFWLNWHRFLDLPLPTAPPAPPGTPPVPGDVNLWRVFIDQANHFDRTLIADVTGQGWSVDRTDYDNFGTSGSDKHGVELLRKVEYPSSTSPAPVEWIVVDRTSTTGDPANDDFASTVRNLPSSPLQSGPGQWGGALSGPGSGVFNGILLNGDLSFGPAATPGASPYDYWVTWARMTRPWGHDSNFDEVNPDDDGDGVTGEPADSNTYPELLGIQADERAPRFIFGRQTVLTSDRRVRGTPASPPTSAGNGYLGDIYRKNDHPDGASPGDKPWFDKRMAIYPSATPLEFRRKPTFFTCNPVFQVTGGAANDIYPAFNALVGPDTAFRYGLYFWWVDRSSGSPVPQSRLFNPSGAPPTPPPGAGIPSKGLDSSPAATPSAPANPGGTTAENFYPRALQMLQKDADFEQVGELLNVWVWGHELPAASVALAGVIGNVWQPVRTFSEYMVSFKTGEFLAQPPGTGTALNDLGARVNRLQHGPVIGNADPTDFNDLHHAIPALPAGLRVLDAFVCDGPGRNAYVTDYNNNGQVALGVDGFTLDACDFALAQTGLLPTGCILPPGAVLPTGAFNNAQAFSGKATPGQININAAPIEVMRALPQGAGLIQEIVRHRQAPYAVAGGSLDNEASGFLRWQTFLPEAISHYRDILDQGVNDLSPGYVRPLSQLTLGWISEPDRAGKLNDELSSAVQGLPQLRTQPGLASIGELLLAVNRPMDASGPSSPLVLGSTAPFPLSAYQQRWRMDMPGLTQFRYPTGDLIADSPTLPAGLAQPDERIGCTLSTDVMKVFDDSLTTFSVSTSPPSDGQLVPDRVARDAEEFNLLFAGMSNLVTTRSDVFTVYFRVRTFRQNNRGMWDATDKDYIVDDSRYVMLVDRSEVNKPSDKPRILYFEKLPN